MDYEIVPLHEGLLGEALALVDGVFMAFEAPGYEAAGIEEFHRYISEENISRMWKAGELNLWCCLIGAKVVGVLAARGAHISLLFVDAAHHRRGIARRLVDTMLAGLGPGAALTVNASPYGQAAYRRLGFRETGPEEVKNGIRFIPMRRPPDGEGA